MENDTQLETEISEFLIANGPHDCAHFFLEKALYEKWPVEKQEWLCTFFLYAQHPEYVQKLCLQSLEAKQDIPWAHFAESLGLLGPLSEKILQLLYYGAKKSKALTNLSRSVFFRFQEMEKIRSEHLESKKNYGRKRKEELLSNAEFLGSQGLVEQQEQYLALALAIDDNHPGIQAQLEKLRNIKASKLLKKKTTEKQELHVPLFWDEPQTKEEVLWCESVTRNMQTVIAEQAPNTNTPGDFPSTKSITTHDQLVLDLALALFQFGHHSGCIELLKDLSSSPQKDWLFVETLFRSRKFAELMEYLDQIEKLNSLDPMTTWSAVYYRAQALWELGEHRGALESMESLVLNEPHFRSAHSILNRWKSELE